MACGNASICQPKRVFARDDRGRSLQKERRSSKNKTEITFFALETINNYLARFAGA